MRDRPSEACHLRVLGRVRSESAKKQADDKSHRPFSLYRGLSPFHLDKESRGGCQLAVAVDVTYLLVVRRVARGFAAEAFFLVDRAAVLVLRPVTGLRAAGLAVDVFFLVDRFAVVALVPVLLVPVLALVAFFAVTLVVRVDFLAEGFAVALVARLAGVFLAGFLVDFLAVAIPMAPQ